MKALSPRMQAVQRERSEELIEERVLQLFKRIPLLLGFSVEEDLSIAGVEVQTWPGLEWGEDFYDELHEQISGALVDLVNERADAAGLLGGRTLARNFH